MFPQQPQQQFRNTNADVKLFYRDSTWTKPPGVSQIYMMLIGGGGTNTTDGGGSGAVTTWWGSAQNVPDNLVVSVSTGDSVNTTVNYRGTNGLNALLTANAAIAGAGGTAMNANQFTASGFYQSVAGQAGVAATPSASTTTFLGGGAKGSVTNIGNYGLSTAGSGSIFQLQPVIVGVAAGENNASIGKGAIGCGGSNNSRPGGPGLVIIAAW